MMDDLNKHLGEFIETNNEYFKIKQMEEKMKVSAIKTIHSKFAFM